MEGRERVWLVWLRETRSAALDTSSTKVVTEISFFGAMSARP